VGLLSVEMWLLSCHVAVSQTPK